ncbi:MAG: sigma-54-dependent Fis family transcriptional regulator [Candidatus Eisenbacteria bacterium]|uniref:Sigma-54-dependent Fis family transcriptional regulator n=1 Tax=Eiseniibacteriota bacterium TaxID=2212470 RepID=A0A956SDL9_UNCEI|nr:sigma-54-dependent Fis family transcriptional regulator [Candidatus Eisenbacteria bacterium]
MSRILVIDDDRALARSLQIHLGADHHDVRVCHNLADGWSLFSDAPDDIVFLDLKLPDGDGRTLLSRMLAHEPRTRVIMISGHQDMHATIDAMRTGAFDYIRKPLDLDQILTTLGKAEQSLESKEKPRVDETVEEMRHHPREIVGRSGAIVDLLKQIAVLSESRVTVLIQGETGSGKELVARALHESAGPSGPFVAVNCAGIVPTLLESELFGHERGAFTGASARKTGKLEVAGKGTIFFDEVGDLNLDLQAKLLRALQEAEFERVGGTESIPLRARVIAATHRDLDALVTAGEFRSDLYFRLAVVKLSVPPLRERKEDIPLLAEYLISRIAEQLGRDPVHLSRDALDELTAQSWPGNVRQLENVLTRAVALHRGNLIEAADIPVDTAPEAPDSVVGTRGAGNSNTPILTLREAERQHIESALFRLDWNITRTADALEISPTTLRKKISDYGLERDVAEPPDQSR